MEFDPTIAYITESDGKIYQELHPSGKDWNEEATKQAVKDKKHKTTVVQVKNGTYKQPVAK